MPTIIDWFDLSINKLVVTVAESKLLSAAKCAVKITDPAPTSLIITSPVTELTLAILGSEELKVIAPM